MRLTTLVPGAEQLRAYRREWFRRDLVAGVVLTGLLAPAGVAYAAAAGLPPVTGIYATIVPLFVYAVFGPSPILVLGPDSALTPLVVAAIAPLVVGPGLLAADLGQAVAVAGALSVIAGVMCIVAGVARFGFVAELLSAPVRHGYLHGIALTIIVGQAAKACGFSVGGESLATGLRGWYRALADGAFRWWPFALATVSIATIAVLRRRTPRTPATLVVVVGGIVATQVLHLADRGVQLVGDLPRGLPVPALPDVSWATARSLLGASLGIALVSFADTGVMSRTMALRHHRHVDANHELVALGLANVASGFFHGFPVSASNSRTPVAESLGARTQLAGVWAAATLTVIAVAAPSTFRHLPHASLAAIVISAAMTLIDLPALAHLLRVRRSEFVLAMAGIVGVAALGPVTGVVVAVGLSVLNFLRLAWKPHTAELVRVDGLKGYHEHLRHPEGRRIPGLLLYRFDGPLFFANARFFGDDLVRAVEARGDTVRCVIVTAEPITDIDTTAAAELRETADLLAARGVELRFAELKGAVRDRLQRYGVFDAGDGERFSARTVGEAVRRYLTTHEVVWVDWEDRVGRPDTAADGADG